MVYELQFSIRSIDEDSSYDSIRTYDHLDIFLERRHVDKVFEFSEYAWVLYSVLSKNF